MVEPNSELDRIKSSDKLHGPYIQAVFNPETSKFKEIVARSNLIILDVGCGEEPRLSWGLGSGDLWVGCDPNAKNGVVTKGLQPVKRSAELVVFPVTAEEIPNFKPGVISIIAPNQKDIVDGRVFNDSLKKFLDSHKEQVLIVVLDTRTVEAGQYQEEAREIIKSWRKENNFLPDAEHPILNRFRLNSADAGAKNIKLCYVRNPRS